MSSIVIVSLVCYYLVKLNHLRILILEFETLFTHKLIKIIPLIWFYLKLFLNILHSNSKLNRNGDRIHPYVNLTLDSMLLYKILYKLMFYFVLLYTLYITKRTLFITPILLILLLNPYL